MLLGYRRKSFEKAHNLISTLRRNSENLDLLVELQKLLLHEIMHGERKIRSLKHQRANLDKNTLLGHATRTEKRVAFLDMRIEKYRQMNYIWRCFGDAIAFLYLDK